MTRSARSVPGALLALLAAVIGYVVWWHGWQGSPDHRWLLSLQPDWATMKPTAAWAAMLLGLSGAVESLRQRRLDWLAVGLCGAGVWPVVESMHGALTGAPVGTANPLFGVEPLGAPLARVPGEPSICSMVGFLVVALGGTVRGLRPCPTAVRVVECAEALVVSLSVVALVGYATDSPLLYCYAAGRSSAMGVLSAVSLLSLSAAGWMVSQRALRQGPSAGR